MMKSNYVIISDGACDLVEDIVGLDYVVPFSVSFDGENYFKSNQDISIEEFYRDLPGKYPKTSVPSVADYVEKFEPQLKQGLNIICITISSYLSSSYQSANIAAEMMKEKYIDRSIFVFDSLHATVSQGLLIREMLKLQEAGASLEKVCSYVTDAKEFGGVNFVVGDMSYLSKGGRIGKTALQTGKTLKLLPIISFMGGKNTIKGMCRGDKAVYKKLIKITNESIEDGINGDTKYVFASGYSDDESFEKAQKLQKLMIEEYGADCVGDMIRIGTTVISHTGPGTYGLGYIKQSS